jgi:hypothetical protein
LTRELEHWKEREEEKQGEEAEDGYSSDDAGHGHGAHFHWRKPKKKTC